MTNLSIYNHDVSGFGMTMVADGGILRYDLDHGRMKLDPVWHGVIARNIYRRGAGLAANGAAGHNRQGNTEVSR
jgi:hypothetical protein